jgi:hypothetical protein
MLGDDGFDKYLEDLRSIWILHWLLTRAPSRAASWEYLFGLWPRPDFHDAEMISWLGGIAKRDLGRAIPEGAIRRDLQCLLHMYAPPRRPRTADELVESPFRDLGMMARGQGPSDAWRFSFGPKPGLSPALVVFCCLDFAARDGSGTAISLSRLAAEPRSPGMVLRISETDIAEALRSHSLLSGELTLTAPLGIQQLGFIGNPAVIAMDVFSREFGIRVPGGTRLDDLLENDGAGLWAA